MKTETPKYMCIKNHVHIPWVQLLSHNPQPKTSVNSLSRTPSPPLAMIWRSWPSVDFRVHNISYNIPIRGMIHAVSDAEHRGQWYALDHSTTIHQHAPSNISARYCIMLSKSSVTRLPRRSASSHLISRFISKYLVPWGQSPSCPVWLLI